MNSKTIVTAMVAMIVAIGMTGIGAATMVYDVSFSGSGAIGGVDISTYTPVGNDVQSVDWVNAHGYGSQQGSYTTGSDWAYIDRTTQINDINNAQATSGTIVATTLPTTPVVATTGINGLAFVQAAASYTDTYSDDSYIKMVQSIRLYDSDMPTVNDAGDERAYVDTEINGQAYNTGANVKGSVMMITDGSLTAGTGIYVNMNDGNLDMDAQAIIMDNTADKESAKVTYDIAVRSTPDTADGTINGYEAVNDNVGSSYIATFVNADAYANGYFYAVTI